MITVDTRLFGDPDGVPIGALEFGLHTPYKLGHQNPAKGLALIQNQEEAQQAYRWWLTWQIELQNPVVIEALDNLGFRAMDGDLILKCPCRSDFCHGYVIKDILEDKLNE